MCQTRVECVGILMKIRLCLSVPVEVSGGGTLKIKHVDSQLRCCCNYKYFNVIFDSVLEELIKINVTTIEKSLWAIKTKIYDLKLSPMLIIHEKIRKFSSIKCFFFKFEVQARV